MKILNFGSCNIDYVYSLDHIVNPGETETSRKLETFPGGKGLNQSIAIARAGGTVYHAGCIGEGGEILADILKKSGVDISYIKNVDAKNGHAIIQVNSKGENSIFLYPGSNEMITTELIDSTLEDFSAGDFVILQNEISNLDYIIKKAYEKGMCIILNPSPFNKNLCKIDLNMISYIILNEVEAKGFSGCLEAEGCLSYFKENYPNLKVMLTLGSRGCVYMDQAREFTHPIFEVDVIDTTAAGDTFAGYFVAEIARGRSMDEVLKIASCASAIAVSREGAAPSIPLKDEVYAALNDFKINTSKAKNELLLKKIEKYIDENIRTAHLEELAEILGYSTVYTGSLVKKLTGCSFSKFLQSRRCTIAAKMLDTTDLTVEEIVNRIGYENQSFFRKIFKEKYGKNPLKYRERR